MSEPSIRERLVGCWRLVAFSATAAARGDAVLVDALKTVRESTALADWVALPDRGCSTPW